MATQAPEHQGNLFQNLPSSGENESFQSLYNQPTLRIERIVSHGHASPADGWYDQTEDEWVFLAQGAARLLFEGHKKEMELNRGDYVLIPAHCRHRVTWTDPDEPTIWLAVHAAR